MPGSQTIQSVERALDVLQHVAQSPGGLTLAELAAALCVKPPTAHALVRTLAGRGFVRRLSGPTRYALGPAAAALAATPAHMEWRPLAQAALEGLAGQFPKATVVQVEAVGGEVATTLRMSPDQPGVLQRPQRQPMSPYSSASDLAFQAFWPPETLARYRQRYAFEEYGAHQWPGPSELEAFLGQVRQLGYAFPQDGYSLVRMAIPLWSPRHELLAVLGLSSPAAVTPQAMITKMIARLLSAGEAFTQSLAQNAKEFT